MVLINSGGAAGTGDDADPDGPDDPDDPDDPPDEVISPKLPDTADDGSKFDKYNGPAAYGDDTGDGTGS
jgi:hypothetical protein